MSIFQKKNSKFDANLKTFQTTLMSPEAIQIADETYLLKDKLDAMVTEMINLARAGKPDEVAALALFLCSDEGKSMNGEVIKMYGGV